MLISFLFSFAFRLSSFHRTNLRRAEAKRKKEFNLEAWEKEDLKHNKLRKNNNNEKAEKYYTNEETN